MIRMYGRGIWSDYVELFHVPLILLSLHYFIS